VSAVSGISLASSAIRCCFVETLVGLGLPGLFPSNGSVSPVPPFLGRVPWGGFPDVTGHIGHSDFLPPLAPHFVAFAWRYHRCGHSFAPGPAGRCPPRPGFWSPGSHTGISRWRRQDLPGSWAPRRIHAVALRPRWDLRARPYGASVLPSAVSTASAPTTISISRLNDAACMLAVYASQPRLSVDVQPRKTRFRPVASLGRAGLATRRGAPKGFSHCSGHGVLLSQALPGAPKLESERLAARRGTGHVA